MSTPTESLGMVALYVAVIFGGRQFMADRAPLKLNSLFKLHNLFLTLLSGGLLVLFLEQLIPTLWRYGVYQNICGAPGWTPQLVTLYYVGFGEIQIIACYSTDPILAKLHHQVYRVD